MVNFALYSHLVAELRTEHILLLPHIWQSHRVEDHVVLLLPKRKLTNQRNKFGHGFGEHRVPAVLPGTGGEDFVANIEQCKTPPRLAGGVRACKTVHERLVAISRHDCRPLAQVNEALCYLDDARIGVAGEVPDQKEKLFQRTASALPTSATD